VLTDYGAAKSTNNSLNNGLDLDIWPAIAYQPPLVSAAVASGQASMATVDEHIRRQLRTLFAFGFFDRDAYIDDTSQIDQDGHHAAAADVEQQGIVLLRNVDGILPLDAGRLRKVAVIGPEADRIKNGGGSSAIDAFRTTSPRQAIEAKLGADRVAYDNGSNRDAAAAAAREADVAIVVVGDQMTEGADKACMGLNCSQSDGIDRDALIDAVAAAQPNTIVLLQTGGPVLTPWREKVKGLVEAWFPGQNGGTAMARVLFGDAEPEGRLPTTFPLREEDLPTSGDPEAYPGVAETVRYKEGVLIGYRWFDEKQLGVAYPFGFGLSYTTFVVSGLQLLPAPGDDLKVSAVVRNSGARAGTAVPQVYVGMPEPSATLVQPPWQLKGFAKVRLDPGQSRRVTFTLDDRAFSYWAGSDWRIAPGCYRIGVGEHSRNLPLQGTVGRGAECGGALQLPTSTCRDRRPLTITLSHRIRRAARVTYAGRRGKVFRRGGRLRARVDLRGLKAGRVKVRISGRSAGGRRVRHTRVFRLCLRRR
jgi:beta-glucosidase